MTRGGLQPDLDFPKENVELGLYGWRIALLCDSELRPVWPVHDVPRCNIPQVRLSGRFREIKGCVTDTQRRIGRTVSLVEGIAIGPSLRSSWSDDSREQGNAEQE